MAHQWFPYCNWSTAEVITNFVWLLLEHWLRLCCVVYNQHIVAIYKSRTGNSNSHHSHLVPDSSNCFHSCFHTYKFCSKYRCFNSRLLFGIASNQSTIHENKESCTRMPSLPVPCMVRITIKLYIHFLSKWFRYISWYCFFQISIKPFPVVIVLKVFLFDFRIRRIIYRLSVVLVTKVCKHVQ